MSPVAELIDNIVPISDFSRGKASRSFAKAAAGSPVVVVKNNVPAAVVLSIEEYRRLSEIEEDYALLSEAAARLERNGDKPGVPFEAVLEEFGIGGTDLDSLDDIELA